MWGFNPDVKVFMITVMVFDEPMLSILSTHSSSNTSVSLLSGFLLCFWYRSLKTNHIFLEEDVVCVFVTYEFPPGTASLSVCASSQRPEPPALLSWTPVTSECCPLENVQRETSQALRFDFCYLDDASIIWKRKSIHSCCLLLMLDQIKRLHNIFYLKFESFHVNKMS